MRRIHPMNSRAGFSIVELAVVVTVGVVIGISILVLSFAMSSAMAMVNGQGTLQMRLALGLNAFNRDVRLATALPVTTAPPVTWIALTQDLTSIGPPSDGVATLILQVPSINGVGQAIPGASDFFIYTFNRATGALTRTIDANDAAPSSRATTGVEPDQAMVVAQDITDVTFAVAANTPPARPDVTITVNGTRTEGQRVFSLQLVSQSALRN